MMNINIPLGNHLRLEQGTDPVHHFNLRTCKMFEGDLPKIAQQLVSEWLEIHKEELLEMWDKQVITKLPPL